MPIPRFVEHVMEHFGQHKWHSTHEKTRSPQAGETIYDSTYGTGGMLISCLAEVKRRGHLQRITHHIPNGAYFKTGTKFADEIDFLVTGGRRLRPWGNPRSMLLMMVLLRLRRSSLRCLMT